MNKVYNLKQDTFIEHNKQLTDMKMYNEKKRRNNEILNGFILIIGIVGFVVAFFQPRELVYNRSSLENSFTNNSNQLAVATHQETNSKKNASNLDLDKHFFIDGFFEVNEVLSFNFDSFQDDSDVVYTLHLGNGDKREIKNKTTYYQYSKSGDFTVKVMANYKGDQKEIFKEKIFIDEAIIVNSEAFVEHN